ncbi:MAG: hypothetical protein H0V82_09015 [Candidatus Protochlamydia sp.]|nr:hypothetical protein [Candidatus Protochlamydia sp.]
MENLSINQNKLVSNILINPLIPPSNELKIVEKHEKHLNECLPILFGMLTPYEAFKEGFERAIASFIKLGNEGKVNKILSEKQTKNIETELMETLIKNLLNDFNSVKFIKKDNKYLAICHGKLYQFSNILEKANFNLIVLTNKDLVAYQKLLNTQTLYQQPNLNTGKPTALDFEARDPQGLCKNISFAEKEAINIYTGHYYRAMNSLMRGNIDDAIEWGSAPSFFTVKEQANHNIKETLLHVIVAVSGLNKLPDFVPSPGIDGKPQKYLYRSEGSLPESVLAQRKWAVLNGGQITTEMGFISTSFSKPAEGFFGEHTSSAVMIKNLKGKKITPLSQFGDSEREVLLPPTQLQWKYQKDVITDVYKNTLPLFIAKPVSVNAPAEKGITKEMFVSTISPKDNLIFGVDTELT